jgi:hypothetical protein
MQSAAKRPGADVRITVVVRDSAVLQIDDDGPGSPSPVAHGHRLAT